MKKFRFESLNMLASHMKNGTFAEVFDDWKWIFSYSRKYVKGILLYTVLGLLSTTLGVVSSVASKYVIDIITGYQMDKLGLLIAIMVGSTVCSVIFKNLTEKDFS